MGNGQWQLAMGNDIDQAMGIIGQFIAPSISSKIVPAMGIWAMGAP